MSAVEPIKIQGLRELQAQLRAFDGESQKRLSVVLNEVGEIVRADAARRVPSRSGRAKASLRTRSSQREAIVMGGSKKVPYYGWLEFGGRIGRDKSQRRTYVADGRYLYPTIAMNRPDIARRLEAGLAEAARAAGLEPT